MIARRLIPVALVAISGVASAQSWRDGSARVGPQAYSYRIKTPVNETVSQLAFPMFVTMPVLPQLTVDVGTAYATARYERRIDDTTTTESTMNGLTDTQVRANYAIGQDFVVLTAGLNLPTGSATVTPNELDAATRIGSDFLSFPISGFGSGLGMTAGAAVSKPAGDWNLGFATSMRYATEYEPFKDASGTVTKFTPGPEIRARVGADHAFGEGRLSLGFTYSKYGDDKANSVTFNTGDRFITQGVLTSTTKRGTDYVLVVWNLYRSSGTLINQSASPSANITSAMMAWSIRAPADVGIEPSVETRVFTQQHSRTSFLANFGLRAYVNRGTWAVAPGLGFSFGQMEAGSSVATVTGTRATLAVRIGR